jgi:hypothetical protein
MAQKLPAVQQEYLRLQLRYDLHDRLSPPNALAVHQIQHGLIFNAVRSCAAGHEVHMPDIGCGWDDFPNRVDPFLKPCVSVGPSPTELRRFNQRPSRFLARGVGERPAFLQAHSRNFVLLNSVLDHCFDRRKTRANCLRVLAPDGGHVFFVSAVRNGALPAPGCFAVPFCCPQCKRDLAFGAKACACGLRLSSAPEGRFDPVELNAELRAALNVK